MEFILKIFKNSKAEKRLFLIILIVVFGSILIGRRNGLIAKTVENSSEKKSLYISSFEKIKSGSDWRPKGYGDGKYLETIPKIKAGAVIDFDSGNVIWSMNLKERIAPASLTKLATVMTALDVENPGEIIDVSENAAEEIPTKLGLKTSEKLTLEEAVAAAILTSANDATEAIADDIGSKVGAGNATFMDLVNKKLEAIGVFDSHFENATGLDSPNQYSTVYDLAIIAHEAKTDYPLISKFASSKYMRLEADSNHELIDLPNWNALLGTYPGVNGLKIGYTENAGHATIVTASRGGVNLMAIVIGAKSLEDREIAAATLLNYGYSSFGIDPFLVGQFNLVKRFEEWKEQLTLF